MEILMLAVFGLSAAWMISDGDDASDDDEDAGGSGGEGESKNDGRDFELGSGESRTTGSSEMDTVSGVSQGTVIHVSVGDLSALAAAYGTGVHGSEGNDTFAASGDEHALYGGAGNDLITLEEGKHDGGHIYGGAGDDTLRATGSDPDDYKRPALYGEDGRDTFELTFEQERQDSSPNRAGAITITDFQPGTDRLKIEAEGLIRAEVHDAPDGQGTHLLLYLSETGWDNAEVEEVATVRLVGVYGLTLDQLGVELPAMVGAAAA